MNRSLTVAEAELVRRLNEEFSRREWPHRSYSRFMRYGAVEHMKTARQPSPEEPRIATPAWALARAAEISAEMAGNIEALGVNIVGDISALGRRPEHASGRARTRRPDADTRATRGRRRWCPSKRPPGPRSARSSPAGRAARAIEEIVRDVDTRSLARALAKRCRQRVRRALPR